MTPFWFAAVAILTFFSQQAEQVLAPQCPANNPYSQVDCLNDDLHTQQSIQLKAVESGTYAQHAIEHMFKLRKSFPRNPQVKLETIQSCKHAPRSGTYLLSLNRAQAPLMVQCVMTFFGGGWTVIQQRFNGLVSFNQTFQTYRNGFGKVSELTEYWLGLEPVYQMSKRRPCELAVELKNREGKYFYAIYTDFGLGDEANQYSLERLGERFGTADDALSHYSKQGPFVTVDRDKWQDWDKKFFAAFSGGGWWFTTSWFRLSQHFYFANLNGDYSGTSYNFYWDPVGHRLRYSRMMIRF